MKIYLAADIEGSCGFTVHEEGKVGFPLYEYFRRQMALEVAAACKGAKNAGAVRILVHDAHDTSRNIDPYLLPSDTELMRCSGGDPYAMLSGIRDDDFDAVVMTGFHAPVGIAGTPASHTFNHRTTALYLNGMPLSEFLFDAYTAASLGISIPFVSGDSTICRIADKLIPGITTVEAVAAIGAGTISRHPQLVIDEIEKKIETALSGNYKICMPDMPASFHLVMHFLHHQDAQFNSFYPDIKKTDDCTLEYTSSSWYEILTMVHFVLDK